MPSFLFSPLLWGLLAVGLPVLIHLINMMRHRRIRWAAMEFLLLSQKRNRTWVMLKQLLLLLLRMAAVAAVVFLVAQPIFSESIFSSLLGGTFTHHVVLLDDSYSMSDNSGGKTAFDRALDRVRRLGEHVADQDLPQDFTLLRFSLVKHTTSSEQPCDLNETPVRSDFKKALQDKLKDMEVSELAAGPLEALDFVARRIDAADKDERVVYLVSDFRSKEWADPTEIKKKLVQLAEAGVHLHILPCTEASKPNLAITALEPEGGTRAAGVPLFMNVTVKNFDAAEARQVAVSLDEDGKSRPGVKFDQIKGGESVTQRFPVFFADAGTHRITARLNVEDAIAVDNRRYCALELAPAQPVLIIDGDPKAARVRSDSMFIDFIFSRGAQANQGLHPQFETTRYLQNHPLDQFSAIFLVNVERLDQSEVTALEQYAQRGGGVAFYLGPLVSAKSYNDALYREGEGLFPAPLAGAVDLLLDRSQRLPDMTVSRHPVLSLFESSPETLNRAMIDKYFALRREWVVPADSTTKIIARTRNGAPLIIDHKFGEGRVVAVLTTAAPTWNNWGRDVTGPHLLLELQSYLALRPEVPRVVGAGAVLRLDRGSIHSPFKLALPSGSSLELTATKDAESSQRPYLELNIPTDATRVSSFYEFTATHSDGTNDTPYAQTLAFNVSPDEGDLKIVDEPGLRAQLKGINPAPEFHSTEDSRYDDSDIGGRNLSKTWGYMLFLIAILLGEQALAYAISYHPVQKEAAR